MSHNGIRLLYKNFGFPLLSINIVLVVVNALANMYTKQILAALLFVFICLVQIASSNERNAFPDLVPAATNQHHGHGRVQIKVYRGPSEGHEHFAPHGYWVKQPADDHRHHH